MGIDTGLLLPSLSNFVKIVKMKKKYKILFNIEKWNVEYGYGTIVAQFPAGFLLPKSPTRGINFSFFYWAETKMTPPPKKNKNNLTLPCNLVLPLFPLDFFIRQRR